MEPQAGRPIGGKYGKSGVFWQCFAFPEDVLCAFLVQFLANFASVRGYFCGCVHGAVDPNGRICFVRVGLRICRGLRFRPRFRIVFGFEAAGSNPWRQNLHVYVNAADNSWYLPVSQTVQATVALAAY